MPELLDVTDKTDFNPYEIDAEALPILQCVCGVKYKLWDQTLGIYIESAEPMPCCGRRLVFRTVVRVYEVKETTHG